jgi:hypothetical protein
MIWAKADPMIVDERIYTLHAGKTAEYLKLYEAKGLGVQKKILGNMLGYFHTEFGPLNQIVHLWGYDSLEDRRVRREKLFADDEWKAYIQEMRPLVHTQENKLLIPATFSPIG